MTDVSHKLRLMTIITYDKNKGKERVVEQMRLLVLFVANERIEIRTSNGCELVPTCIFPPVLL